ncbi:putative serine/threonine-protein kinase nek2 [Diplonema papillatum]|nr:putative serine/threonine-protein kinase nek2 [Diplonema papillatum]
MHRYLMHAQTVADEPRTGIAQNGQKVAFVNVGKEYREEAAKVKSMDLASLSTIAEILVNESTACVVAHVADGFVSATQVVSERSRADPVSYFAEDDLWRYLIQAVLVLKELHRVGILHGDIAPSAMLNVSTADIKLGVPLLGRRGTTHYQAGDPRAGERSDVFELGCLMVELLALQNAKTVTLTPGRYSVELCFLLRKMTDEDVRNRPTVSQIVNYHAVKKRTKVAKETHGSPTRTNKARDHKEHEERVNVRVAAKGTPAPSWNDLSSSRPATRGSPPKVSSKDHPLNAVASGVDAFAYLYPATEPVQSTEAAGHRNLNCDAAAKQTPDVLLRRAQAAEEKLEEVSGRLHEYESKHGGLLEREKAVAAKEARVEQFMTLYSLTEDQLFSMPADKTHAKLFLDYYNISTRNASQGEVGSSASPFKSPVRASSATAFQSTDTLLRTRNAEQKHATNTIASSNAATGSPYVVAHSPAANSGTMQNNHQMQSETLHADEMLPNQPLEVVEYFAETSLISEDQLSRELVFNNTTLNSSHDNSRNRTTPLKRRESVNFPLKEDSSILSSEGVCSMTKFAATLPQINEAQPNSSSNHLDTTSNSGHVGRVRSEVTSSSAVRHSAEYSHPVQRSDATPHAQHANKVSAANTTMTIDILAATPAGTRELHPPSSAGPSRYVEVATSIHAPTEENHNDDTTGISWNDYTDSNRTKSRQITSTDNRRDASLQRRASPSSERCAPLETSPAWTAQTSYDIVSTDNDSSRSPSGEQAKGAHKARTYEGRMTYHALKEVTLSEMSRTPAKTVDSSPTHSGSTEMPTRTRVHAFKNQDEGSNSEWLKLLGGFSDTNLLTRHNTEGHHDPRQHEGASRQCDTTRASDDEGRNRRHCGHEVESSPLLSRGGAHAQVGGMEAPLLATNPVRSSSATDTGDESPSRAIDTTAAGPSVRASASYFGLGRGAQQASSAVITDDERTETQAGFPQAATETPPSASTARRQAQALLVAADSSLLLPRGTNDDTTCTDNTASSGKRNTSTGYSEHAPSSANTTAAPPAYLPFNNRSPQPTPSDAARREVRSPPVAFERSFQPSTARVLLVSGDSNGDGDDTLTLPGLAATQPAWNDEVSMLVGRDEHAAASKDEEFRYYGLSKRPSGPEHALHTNSNGDTSLEYRLHDDSDDNGSRWDDLSQAHVKSPNDRSEGRWHAMNIINNDTCDMPPAHQSVHTHDVQYAERCESPAHKMDEPPRKSPCLSPEDTSPPPMFSTPKTVPAVPQAFRSSCRQSSNGRGAAPSAASTSRNKRGSGPFPRTHEELIAWHLQRSPEKYSCASTPERDHSTNTVTATPLQQCRIDASGRVIKPWQRRSIQESLQQSMAMWHDMSQRNREAARQQQYSARRRRGSAGSTSASPSPTKPRQASQPTAGSSGQPQGSTGRSQTFSSGSGGSRGVRCTSTGRLFATPRTSYYNSRIYSPRSQTKRTTSSSLAPPSEERQRSASSPKAAANGGNHPKSNFVGRPPSPVLPTKAESSDEEEESPADLLRRLRAEKVRQKKQHKP